MKARSWSFLLLVKTAVDVRPLLHPFSGIGRYLKHIRPTLTKLGVDFIDLQPDRPELRARLAATFHYARVAQQAGAEVYWSPRHHLPIALNMPSVVTIHDLVWKYYPETMKFGRAYYDRVLSKYAMKNASQIICVSQATANDVLAEMPEVEDRLNIIPLAPTLKPADVTENKNARKPYILFVGTLEPRKNLARTISAYKLADVSEDYDLVVVANTGWGSERPEISATVRLLTQLCDSDLANLYANCAFVVAPSLYEGFGLQIAEAHAFGKAVVTSNRASMPEVCGDGGLLVDPEDETAIAQAIRTLSKDHLVRQALEANAEAQAAGRNWENVALRTLEVFERTRS